MRKYIVKPGYVVSRSNGDIHWVGANQLMKLYGVDPLECIIDHPQAGYHTTGYSREELSQMKVLEPRRDGEYQTNDNNVKGR